MNRLRTARPWGPSRGGGWILLYGIQTPRIAIFLTSRRGRRYGRAAGRAVRHLRGMYNAQRPPCAGPCLGAQRVVKAGRGRPAPGHAAGLDGARAATPRAVSPAQSDARGGLVRAPPHSLVSSPAPITGGPHSRENRSQRPNERRESSLVMPFTPEAVADGAASLSMATPERTKGATHVVCCHLHGPRRD